MKKIIMRLLILFVLTGCNQMKEKQVSENKTSKECKDDCCEKKATSGTNGRLTCKLTSPELQQRKTTVLESLRKKIIGKKELINGYAFKFHGDDKTIDELTAFAKTERQCCNFFTFNLAISGDTNSVWIEITGVQKAKDFIRTELEL